MEPGSVAGGACLTLFDDPHLQHAAQVNGMVQQDGGDKGSVDVSC